MSYSRMIFLTALAMTAFAGNSLVTRVALKQTSISPAHFAAIRLISGAVALQLIVWIQAGRRGGGGRRAGDGNWPSALALFAYAACFTFAYTNLTAATGALLLFGAVQATMIGHGIWSGERLSIAQWGGVALALGGLVLFLMPGLSAPPPVSSMLMLAAGVAWGVYSLRGRSQGSATAVTAGNFLRTVPLAFALSIIVSHSTPLDRAGFWYAALSGTVTSGLGYAVWYAVLPALGATKAATVQLSVPVLSALAGVLLLGETLTLRLALASIAVIGGIALVISGR